MPAFYVVLRVLGVHIAGKKVLQDIFSFLMSKTEKENRTRKEGAANWPSILVLQGSKKQNIFLNSFTDETALFLAFKVCFFSYLTELDK